MKVCRGIKRLDMLEKELGRGTLRNQRFGDPEPVHKVKAREEYWSGPQGQKIQADSDVKWDNEMFVCHECGKDTPRKQMNNNYCDECFNGGSNGKE